MISEPPVEQEEKEAAPALRDTQVHEPPETLEESFAVDEPHGRRPWLRWLLVIGFVVLALLLFIYRPGRKDQAQGGSRGAGAGKGAERPVPVLAAAARTKDVGVYLTGLGTVAPLNTATVRSRVDGQLLRITFHEGQTVRAGELLAELDPRPFQIQLLQAQGQRAKDEAALANARVDLRRYQALIAGDAIPRQQLDTQAAAVAQFEAALKSDQAQIESAKLNLAYSRVTAPTAGRLGLRQVDVGNIVHAGDANGIVVITQLQPINVVFTLAGDYLPQVLPQLRAGRSLRVEAYDRDLNRKLADGQLLAVDNQIDPTTGTVRLKAIFPNPDEALFPNQFVNARLLVDTLHNAVVVPAAALQRSPQSTFVYVVKPDRTVQTRDVEVAQAEGEEAAIHRGLAPGEAVVVDGLDKLRPGMKVVLTMAGAGGQRGGGAPRRGGGGRKAPA
jgi:multidrug efflux system membrane fusion protein